MQSRSLLTKMIVFGCLISILPVVFVGTFSYIRSSSQVQKQVNVGEMQFIKQVNSNIEQILMTVNHTLTNLVDSTIMADVLRTPLRASDFRIYNDLRKEISHLQAFDTKVEDVVLLNAEQNWLIKNSGLYRMDEHADHQQFAAFFALEQSSAWVLLDNQQFRDKISNSNCAYTVSLVKKLPVRKANKKALAFANIPACAIAALIQAEESKEVMIADASNRIIAHSDPVWIGKSLRDTGYFRDHAEWAGESGQYRVLYENHPYTVTYYQSEFNHWTYLSVVSIDELTRESKEIGLFTFAISMIIIAVSVCFVWLSSKRLYSPVHKLLQFITENGSEETRKSKNELQIIEEHIRTLFSSHSRMESEIKDHTQQIRTLFLNRLFTGAIRAGELTERLAYFGLDRAATSWRTMSVLTLQIDTLENTRYDLADMELLAFAVSNIVEETVPNEQRLPTVWLDHTLVLLLGTEKDADGWMNDYVYQVTEQLQAHIQEYLGLSVSIGISLPFHAVKKAPRAYQEGMEALKHRMLLGKGVIIPFRNLNAGKHSMLYYYPAQAELELVDAIKIADRDEALKQLRVWMDKAFERARSPQEYQVSIMRLLNKLLVTQQEAGISYEQTGAYGSSFYEELLSLHMREEIEEWFKDKVILPLLQVFSDRRDSQYHTISEQIIDMIQQYYDTEITLEECASKLHYNANYLSSVFKKETGLTFSEYLTNYRLAMAKSWLIETNMTIREIAEKLKYNNPQNFIRSFRKLEGMTPGLYREKYKESV
ncbi:AraC family transcriptional regulator [Xylanibacillus composti]|uniref:Putative HTH-type transcriptional regulator YtdP n=1 Tax=Xylanibacillus composti TaxID=1572762 RepID=A0A8J4H695_9BACL|nr:helix-turn-helix domain-containing protein [Xylanibacillus composti]MDT9726351.1 AraC family transcriptional regulator [Xylanibacillus composti]GIQ70541.1 putative HTH-type transcriptional regulator YtdP [Xylanibacillus composti]